ncbi:MAG: FAD-dependent oxidoreductase [Candidatus Brocadiia bacterium]
MANRPKTFDVIVAGAGPAGIATALSAARDGMKTLLIERENTIGGIVMAGYHAALCGLYASDPTDPADTLNPGIPRETACCVSENSKNASGVQQVGRARVLPLERAALLRCWEGMLAAELEIELRYETTLIGVKCADNCVETIQLSDGSELRPGVLIDATGNAEVAGLAGVPRLADPPENRQLGGAGIYFGGLTADRNRLRLDVPYHLREATEDGRLPHCARFTTFAPCAEPDRGICKLAVPVEFFGQNQKVKTYINDVLELLRKDLQVLAEAEVLATSPRALPRDGPRLRGQTILTEEDVLAGKTFKGHNAKGAWPIEFWHQEEGPQYEYLPDNEYYEIPAACLRAERLHNLICAGRCISATARAAASLRVAGICLATGQLAAVTACELLTEM